MESRDQDITFDCIIENGGSARNGAKKLSFALRTKCCRMSIGPLEPSKYVISKCP